MLRLQEETTPGAPAYMVSFGDMMTLILTFFILLVSLSKTQDAGLLAQGVGSFIVAIESHGLPGIMPESERKEVFEHLRRRFNLPPEDDPDRRADPLDAADLELIRSRAVEALKPHDETGFPRVALFEADSAALTDEAREYLERLASSMRPMHGQLLLLEGHARDAGRRFAGDDRLLATARAQAVRAHLVEEHGFDPERVECRAWLEEIEGTTKGSRAVDARLVTPPTLIRNE